MNACAHHSKPLVQLRFASYPSNSTQETAVPRPCLSSRVHALHMRRQLVFSVESFATSARAAMAGRVVTPEAGLVGGMERGMVSPQHRWTTEGLACAALIVAHILSVAEYGTDTRDSIVVVVGRVDRIGRVDGSPRPSTLLFRADHVAWKRLSKGVQVWRVYITVERWHVLAGDYASPDAVLKELGSQDARGRLTGQHVSQEP